MPIKTKIRGPAPVAADATKDDIIDEAINYFRANILFRNFEVSNDADRLLIYLTLTITNILGKLVKKSKSEATQIMNGWALEEFLLPGDPRFALGGLVSAPANKNDAAYLKSYLVHVRQELSARLIERVYKNNANLPDKWWMCFQKRKFLGKEL